MRRTPWRLQASSALYPPTTLLGTMTSIGADGSGIAPMWTTTSAPSKARSIASRSARSASLKRSGGQFSGRPSATRDDPSYRRPLPVTV